MRDPTREPPVVTHPWVLGLTLMREFWVRKGRDGHLRHPVAVFRVGPGQSISVTDSYKKADEVSATQTATAESLGSA